MALDRTTLVTGVTVLAALAVGSAVTTHLPQPDAVSDAPFVSGRTGQPVTLRTGTVAVEALDASSKITDGLRHAVSKHGVFLVITLTWQPADKPLPLSTRSVLTAADGRRYVDASPVPSSCTTTQPGLRVRCQQVFELPADALEGASLDVPADPTGNTEGDHVARFDLGIDAARASSLRSRTDELTLRRTEPAGPA